MNALAVLLIIIVICLQFLSIGETIFAIAALFGIVYVIKEVVEYKPRAKSPFDEALKESELNRRKFDWEERGKGPPPPFLSDGSVNPAYRNFLYGGDKIGAENNAAESSKITATEQSTVTVKRYRREVETNLFAGTGVLNDNHDQQTDHSSMDTELWSDNEERENAFADDNPFEPDHTMDTGGRSKRDVEENPFDDDGMFSDEHDSGATHDLTTDHDSGTDRDSNGW